MTAHDEDFHCKLSSTPGGSSYDEGWNAAVELAVKLALARHQETLAHELRSISKGVKTI